METTRTPLSLRHATVADIPQLALFNQQLIQDEGHDSQASLIELEQRMTRWLSGPYVVALIELGEEPVAFASWREDEDGVYLRQFFVAREQRKSGVGRATFALLDQLWRDQTVKLDALLHNERALSFYRALGFADYSLVMRRLPTNASR